jgi:hypothetical protein
MLQQALNRHSQIIIPPETKYFFSFLRRSHHGQLQHLRRINADLQIELAGPGRAVSSTRDARAFFGEMARLYVARLRRGSVTYFGEKTPEHTGRLGHILRVFPEAKIIFLYRDGRDVALSLSKVAWMHTDIYVNFAIWLHYYQKLRAAQALRSPNIQFVRYEDVVSDPAQELRRVLDFLELPFEPDVADGHGNCDGIPEREYAWKGRALTRITSERIGTWRRELSDHQIRLIESFGGRALQALKYQLTTSGKGRLPVAFYLRLYWNLLTLTMRLPWKPLLDELFADPLPKHRLRTAHSRQPVQVAGVLACE